MSVFPPCSQKNLKEVLQKLLSVLDFDIWVRYQPVCKYLRRVDPIGRDSVLEVGSGSLGFTRYLKRKTTGLDKEFTGEISPHLHAQKGNVTHLPFQDQSFDHVISVDLLEHLPKTERVLAVEEVLRVARKGAIFVVPCSKESEEAERRLASLYQRHGKEIPEWLSEHLSNGLPTVEEILETIKTQNNDLKITVSPNQSLWMWSFCMWLFTLGTISFFLTMVLFWVATPIIFPLSRLGQPYRRVFIVSKKN